MGSPDFEYDAMKQIRVQSHECWKLNLTLVVVVSTFGRHCPFL